jgi:DNA-binding ferritin-like protein (Dps family)
MISDKYDKITVYTDDKIRFKSLKPYLIIKYGITDDSDVAVFKKVLDILEKSLKDENSDRAKNE